MSLALWIGLAYLVGGIPSSFLAARVAGIDLRQHGSKNLGATNLYRVLGWKYAVPAGAFDVAKGFVAVFFFAPRAGTAYWIPLAVGFAAIVGHVFPVYLKFVGGKGVATAGGAVLAMAPLALGVSVLVWSVVLMGTGYMSLASIAGVLAFPIAVWVLTPGDTPLIVAGLSISAFILFTHRSNIGRLYHGTEPRFGRGRSD